jgi:disulfide oxidoreductase YuzD
MNRILIFLSTIIFSSSCNSQKREIEYSNTIKVDKLTPDFEKFDTTFLKKEKNKSNTLQENSLENNKVTDNVKAYFNENSSGINYTEFDSYNNILKEIIETKSEFTVKKYLTPLIIVNKVYYKNGNIKMKGIANILGFGIGKVYYFDDKGKIIEGKDYDKGYKFDHTDVYDFCKKNNIDLSNQKDASNIKIQKIIHEGIPCWYIANNDSKGYDFYILDGKNGSLLKKGKTPLPLKTPKNYRYK